MADTETIRQIVKTGEAALPDRVQTLALAAIDEGFQDEVKELLVQMRTSLISEPGKVTEAVERASVGYAASCLARQKMRALVASKEKSE